MFDPFPAPDPGTCDRCGTTIEEGDPVDWSGTRLCCQDCLDEIAELAAHL